MMSMKSERPAFTKQPFHHVLIDVNLPMTSENIQNISDSLTNLLLLVNSIKGSCRIPMFGLTVTTNTSSQCIFPLQNVQGNFPSIYAAICKLQPMTACLSIEDSSKINNIYIRKSLEEAVDQFIHENNKRNKMNHLQVTLISAQPLHKLISIVEEFLQCTVLEDVKKIQILRVTMQAANIDDAKTQTSNYVENLKNISELIEVTNLQCIPPYLDGFFKDWLHDCTTDNEHLHLSLTSNDGSTMIIKCDLHEPFLNPGVFAYGNCYQMITDPLLINGPISNNGRKPQTTNLPTYELQVESLVPNDSLCESVLYGMPLLLYPTFCWKIEWAELEINRQRFLSLGQLLNERDCALLVQMRTHTPVVKFNEKTPKGYFAIFASRSGTMLIKPLASGELLLPTCHNHYDDILIPQNVRDSVSTQLASVPLVEDFNPINLQSGLYSSLKTIIDNTNQSLETPKSSKWLPPFLAKPYSKTSHAIQKVYPIALPSTELKGFQLASKVFAKKS